MIKHFSKKHATSEDGEWVLSDGIAPITLAEGGGSKHGWGATGGIMVMSSNGEYPLFLPYSEPCSYSNKPPHSFSWYRTVGKGSVLTLTQT